MELLEPTSLGSATGDYSLLCGLVSVTSQQIPSGIRHVFQVNKCMLLATTVFDLPKLLVLYVHMQSVKKIRNLPASRDHYSKSALNKEISYLMCKFITIELLQHRKSGVRHTYMWL